MSEVAYSGFDVDDEHLANKLRELADATDKGIAVINTVDENVSAKPEEPVEFTIEVTFNAAKGHPITKDSFIKPTDNE